MAITTALAKKRKLNAFHHLRNHKVCKRHSNSKLFRTIDFQAAYRNQTCVCVPNSYSANGKSIGRRRIQHSRLFNRPLRLGSVEHSFEMSGADLSLKQTISYQCEISGSKNFQHGSDKVEETIKLFRKVLSDLKRKNIDGNNIIRSCDIYTKAACLLQKQRKWLNLEKRLGTIPGIGVHNEFQYRAELRIVGLHCQFTAGIDYVKINGEILATSIVDSGRYFSNTGNVESLEVLYYYGAGGNPSVQKTQPIDQRLVRGNLALYNSMKRRSPVRVIRKIHEFPEQSSKFVYEGLFIVVSCQQVREKKYGKLVFEFILRREKEKRNPIRSSGGCDCTDGCSDSEDCSCKIENGGKIPYNYKGCLVNPRPIIIECGPCCKCYESCLNRLSQRLINEGPKIELEKFRNRLGYYGIRSKSFIPKGSFVCEYKVDIRRLINRSYNPNLIAQKVVYDHKDGNSPHVMLFAMEDIPVMKELTIGN